MKINAIIVTSLVLTFSAIFGQDYYLTSYFDFGVGHVNWIYYDYEYCEFNDSASLDSSITFSSFKGLLTVSIDDRESKSDTILYKLRITKDGTEIIQTFFDTLSVEDTETEYFDTVYVVGNINEGSGFEHISGWIFPDTLYESVDDSLDTIPIYPYSRLYNYYQTNDDSSLYVSDDTLLIHYRPKPYNSDISSYSVDFILNLQKDVRSFSRYSSNSGKGFYENFNFDNASWASVKGTQNDLLNYSMSLNQNYPNPFNPTTTIKFSLHNRTDIKLIIYDVLGRQLETLVDESRNSGDYDVIFDGSKLSSGIYYYRLISGNNGITKKFVILK